uniref:Membrane protein insertion efficiency factor YidD n=2 Tax=Setaria TaxID=4554 RepID=K3ZLU1_SETIT
ENLQEIANHHPLVFPRRRAAVAMAAAAPSTSASFLPVRAAQPLAGITVSFGASYQKRRKIPARRVRCAADDEEEVKDLGVNVALSMLKFYKREISPLLPSSCRYVPTCSEYSMQAYKRYGVVKGTILTAWRLCRCNPLGGYGYDPPRWFGEEDLPLE